MTCQPIFPQLYSLSPSGGTSGLAQQHGVLGNSQTPGTALIQALGRERKGGDRVRANCPVALGTFILT